MSSTWCKTCVQLVKAARLERSNATLSTYDEEAMRSAFDEVQEHLSHIHDQIGEVKKRENSSLGKGALPEENARVYFHLTCILRNKRCTMAYVNERMEKLKQQRWQRGGPLSEEALEPLSTSERRFIRDYNDNLQDYTRKMGRLMDVNKDLVPPKESYVEVRVLKEQGEVMTEDGPIFLDANSCHLLRREDAEDLIRQGVVEHVPWD